MSDVVKMPQIGVELERLEKVICRCAQLACDLEGRLHKVLVDRPSTPTEGNAVETARNLCPLALGLDALSQIAGGIVDNLEDIHARLAL